MVQSLKLFLYWVEREKSLRFLHVFVPTSDRVGSENQDRVNNLVLNVMNLSGSFYRKRD